MALTKKDEEKIDMLFQKAVTAGKRSEKQENNKYKKTEKRLYAYPVLKRNIARYKKDIIDIQKEDLRTSKDFVLFVKNSGGAEKMDIEELRKAKILLIEQKIARDQKEIEEIDTALKEIENEEYYPIIELQYFKGMSQEQVAQQLHCDKVTIWRNRKLLINKLNYSLYGADAL
ncbi:hypothetical protein Ga0466249_002793 [Sporomusaceae bacterium BoRhaA]|uniref:ECF-type sigma factor n=1 Tax=Pelorhabdus rhamnosifermentans TaxID=2772457 RepID=UPI001C06298A|nr:ECF-type sigma factor [Pelorhabdus rhamnosifermentans]MBU2701674.1 hypothetical protein [Pelorhabdus rhamnosifermentans]